MVREDGMEADESAAMDGARKRKRRKRVSTAELYTALEGLLSAAEAHIDWLDSYVTDVPDDEDHAGDVERVRQGKAALDLARRLIARKTYTICRIQRVLREEEEQDHGRPTGNDAGR